MMRSIPQVFESDDGLCACLYLNVLFVKTQEPMMQATADAMTPSSTGSTSQTTTPAIPGARPNTSALPNPWATGTKTCS